MDKRKEAGDESHFLNPNENRHCRIPDTACSAAPSLPDVRRNKRPEVVNCMAKVLKTIDAELNVGYQRALKVTKNQWTPTDVQNLKDAQRKWIAYRDAVCKAEYGLVGGRARPLVHT